VVDPDDFCQQFKLVLAPASLFESGKGATISSDIFNEKPQNSYSVVQNENGVVIGQLVSSGVQGK